MNIQGRINGTEVTRIDSSTYGNLTCVNSGISNQWIKDSSFNKPSEELQTAKLEL